MTGLCADGEHGVTDNPEIARRGGELFQPDSGARLKHFRPNEVGGVHFSPVTTSRGHDFAKFGVVVGFCGA